MENLHSRITNGCSTPRIADCFKSRLQIRPESVKGKHFRKKINLMTRGWEGGTVWVWVKYHMVQFVKLKVKYEKCWLKSHAESSLTFCGLGIYIVGISKPHLLRPGRRHSSWTICIITLCGNKQIEVSKVSFLGWPKAKYEVDLPVCLFHSLLHLPCWGRTTPYLHISHSASPRCWVYVCRAPDPSGRRTRTPGRPVLLHRK